MRRAPTHTVAIVVALAVMSVAVGSRASAAGTVHARGGGALGCSQLGKIATLFPTAKAVGFTTRDAVKRAAARQPIWPGWCGRMSFWTTYVGLTGSVDVRVTLYATPHDVEAALGEPAYGPVWTQPNGSRVRGSGPDAVSVNGAPATHTGVVSAYRNLFVSSTSISLTDEPVSIPVQLRLHRAIQKAFRSLR
jgi:hypothetical protein